MRSLAMNLIGQRKILATLLAVCAVGLTANAGFAITVNSFRVAEGKGLWPNLLQLDNGTILAQFFNKPAHGTVEGDLEVWASTNGGLDWAYRSTSGPAEPGTNRRHASAGLTHSGDIVTLVSGCSDPGGDCTALKPWISSSTDDGFSWNINKNKYPTPNDNAPAYWPFGDIIQASDGTLRGMAYGVNSQGVHTSYMMLSPDDGASWFQRSVVGTSLNETAPLSLGGGEWLAVARKFAGGMNLYRSSDDGVSWQFQEQITPNEEFPGHLLELHDGRIVLTYGDRNSSHRGIDAMISDDQGLTWGDPIRIKDVSGNDIGYPSTIQRPDGKLVTAWYSNGGGYHMGIGIWDAPGGSMIPGDFNSDGDVNGVDFLQWQRNTGSGDLAQWRANYGNGAGGNASASAVPEPATALSLALLASGLLCSSRRR